MLLTFEAQYYKLDINEIPQNHQCISIIISFRERYCIESVVFILPASLFFNFSCSIVNNGRRDSLFTVEMAC